MVSINIQKKRREYYLATREIIIQRSKDRYNTKREDIEFYKESNKLNIASTLKTYKEAYRKEIALKSKERNKRPDVIFKIYQRSAHKRNIPFLLTYEEFLNHLHAIFSTHTNQ